MLKFNSIKMKILVPVIGAIVLGFIIITSAVYIIAGSEIRNDINEISKDKVEKITSYCENMTQQLKIETELVAEMDDVIVGLESNEFFNGNQSAIEKVKRICSNAEEFGVSDLHGNAITDNGSNLNLSDREYMKQALKGQTVISDPVISKATGNPVVSCAVPVKNSKGVILGAFFQLVSLNELGQEINKVKFGETGYAYIVDKTGLTIAHPDKSKILKENALGSSDSSLSSLQEVLKKMVAGETGYASYYNNGEKKMMCYGYIETTGWSVAVVAPEKEIFKSLNNIMVTLIISCIALVALICFIIIITIEKTIKPVYKISETIDQVAEGNLTVKADISSNDEIGHIAVGLNKMIENLKIMVNKIRESGAVVASTAEQESATSEEIASSSENQSSSAQETLSSMEELDASIQNISKNIVEVSDHVNGVTLLINDTEKMMEQVSNLTEDVHVQSQNSIKVTNVGQEAVDKSKNGMDEIDKAVNNLVSVIKVLGKSAVDIGEIVDVIDDIAEQTNLLALNAAIEAARAGEHGRGFAVVAGAVSSLAEKSGEATKEITKLIRGIQEEVNRAVETAKDGAEQVKEGVKLTIDVEDALHTIKEAVQKTAQEINAAKELLDKQAKQIKIVTAKANNVSELTNTMAATVEEQTAASAEVVKAVENISESVRQIATGTGDIASSADALAKEAQDLTGAISSFKID